MEAGLPSEVICEAEEYALKYANFPPEKWTQGIQIGLTMEIPMTATQLLYMLQAAYIAGRLRHQVKGKEDFSVKCYLKTNPKEPDEE